jgi:hypothetical protein
MDNLTGGTKTRIIRMKKWADKINASRAKHSPSVQPMPWQEAYRPKCGSTPIHGPNFSEDGRRGFIPVQALEGLRQTGMAHDIVRLKHTGWYADAYCSELYCGQVWQMPARNGSPRYIAGYVEQDAEYAVIESEKGQFCIYDDKEEAARSADYLAEKCAERQREYSEAERAENDAMELKDDAKTAVHAIVKALKDQKQVGALAGSLCEYLVDELQEAREQWNEALGKWLEAKRHSAWVERMG